jgi:hypothetical protein
MLFPVESTHNPQDSGPSVQDDIVRPDDTLGWALIGEVQASAHGLLCSPQKPIGTLDRAPADRRARPRNRSHASVICQHVGVSSVAEV